MTKQQRSPGQRSRNVSLKDLSDHFHLPINDVARKLGLCVTVLKQRCRELGISRWPYRKVRKLDNLISALESSFPLQNLENSEMVKNLNAARETRNILLHDPNSTVHLKLGKVKVSARSSKSVGKVLQDLPEISLPAISFETMDSLPPSQSGGSGITSHVLISGSSEGQEQLSVAAYDHWRSRAMAEALCINQTAELVSSDIPNLRESTEVDLLGQIGQQPMGVSPLRSSENCGTESISLSRVYNQADLPNCSSVELELSLSLSGRDTLLRTGSSSSTSQSLSAADYSPQSEMRSRPLSANCNVIETPQDCPHGLDLNGAGCAQQNSKGNKEDVFIPSVLMRQHSAACSSSFGNEPVHTCSPRSSVFPNDPKSLFAVSAVPALNQSELPQIFEKGKGNPLSTECFQNDYVRRWLNPSSACAAYAVKSTSEQQWLGRTVRRPSYQPVEDRCAPTLLTNLMHL
eukprot:TRINITY_DN2303_c0_g1_i6.p1 TRINITY_DN2303_c0_g1~~TRINITY_DN2303_c0_g1_i6.p1  ORF type:complete len:461 (+),score=32.82 TRINITY_DN2303_c0_g1_i6:85-1467(+)